jgi:hypothetical protein
MKVCTGHCTHQWRLSALGGKQAGRRGIPVITTITRIAPSLYFVPATRFQAALGQTPIIGSGADPLPVDDSGSTFVRPHNKILRYVVLNRIRLLDQKYPE